MKTSYFAIPLFVVCHVVSFSGLQAATEDAKIAKPAALKTAVNDKPKAGISPQELAKLKNVPATLKNPNGDFTLVAVIEGVGANKKLTQSLKVVGAQRQRLAKLTHQFEQTATNLPQQRELLATQINEIRKILQTNLQFMAQNFAYSLNFNYLLVPHEVELLAVTEKNGKKTARTAHEFKTAKAYEACQAKRTAYLKLKQAQMKATQTTQKKMATKESFSQSDVKIAPTPEMKKIQQELIKLYQYDPEKDYQINFKKTAIYARKMQ